MNMCFFPSIVWWKQNNNPSTKNEIRSYIFNTWYMMTCHMKTHGFTHYWWHFCYFNIWQTPTSAHRWFNSPHGGLDLRWSFHRPEGSGGGPKNLTEASRDPDPLKPPSNLSTYIHWSFRKIPAIGRYQYCKCAIYVYIYFFFWPNCNNISPT